MGLSLGIAMATWSRNFHHPIESKYMLAMIQSFDTSPSCCIPDLRVFAGTASLKESSEAEETDEEEGRAGAILKRPKEAGQGWSKSESSRKIRKKGKTPRLHVGQQ